MDHPTFMPMKSSIGDEMEDGAKARNKFYISRTIHDILCVVAPKMVQRRRAHFSHGVADDLDDLKYSDYKYWSNPLETKLPEAPGIEIYCLYGVENHGDGDENVPVLSAGFMCAKGWRGRTRFNPSGMKTFVREYRHETHTAATNARVSKDVLGNLALIEDIMRLAAGLSGSEIGGDQVYSDIFSASDHVKLQVG